VTPIEKKTIVPKYAKNMHVKKYLKSKLRVFLLKNMPIAPQR
jgi:hypothetical protein